MEIAANLRVDLIGAGILAAVNKLLKSSKPQQIQIGLDILEIFQDVIIKIGQPTNDVLLSFACRPLVS